MYKKINQKPIFHQIIDEIRSLIREGKLEQGDLLPPERELSKLIGVNRHSLREALKILEYMGILKSKTGVGTIITGFKSGLLSRQSNELSNISPQKIWFELIEVRKAIEPYMAKLAAERATVDDLKSMAELIDEIEAKVARKESGTAASERFHMALAKATQNNAFIRIAEPITGMLVQYRETSVKVPGRSIMALDEHKEIYLSVKNRQPKKAAQAMLNHLNKLEEMVRKVENSESKDS